MAGPSRTDDEATGSFFPMLNLNLGGVPQPNYINLRRYADNAFVEVLFA